MADEQANLENANLENSRVENPRAENENLAPMTLRDHFVPSTYISPSCIVMPNVEAHHYEIKSTIIRMLPIYHGFDNEDPYKHLDELLEICSTIKMRDFPQDALRILLFPFSLKERANSRRASTSNVGKPSNSCQLRTLREEASQVDAITHKVFELVAPYLSSSQNSPSSAMCAHCTSTFHNAEDCAIPKQFSGGMPEQANAMFFRPGNNPYSNTYNIG
ncbi:uncharacterized protein LOC132266369 [Cornus florida]|uniref:uncharacterized protein LOC132266369 n=1 Tax=Cornus florida TaxID=4283 RepID=UPI00289ED877|nr:uncharacterized protein LOC132266369 [Cornus florida]